MLAFRALTSKSCPSLVRIHTSARWSGARVAVVLSGCGVYDGTEIHEASARRASSMSEMLLRKPSAIDGMSSSLSTKYEDKVHPCIDLVDSLRSLGVEKDLNLSAIASIGDQSLGKRIKMV